MNIRIPIFFLVVCIAVGSLALGQGSGRAQHRPPSSAPKKPVAGPKAPTKPAAPAMTCCCMRMMSKMQGMHGMTNGQGMGGMMTKRDETKPGHARKNEEHGSGMAGMMDPKMMEEMRMLNERIESLRHRMNDAKGEERLTAAIELINAMADERRMMHEMMHSMMGHGTADPKSPPQSAHEGHDGHNKGGRTVR